MTLFVSGITSIKKVYTEIMVKIRPWSMSGRAGKIGAITPYGGRSVLTKYMTTLDPAESSLVCEWNNIY